MTPYLDKIVEIAKPNKYTKWYRSIVLKALERPQDRKILKATIGYVESHHILPECFGLGGEKDKNNLVFLTAKEHFIVHLCATKMFESIFKNKMTFAFQQLRSANPHQKNRYISSRLYAKIKPSFKSFVRLYKGDAVKYLYESQVAEMSDLENEGWSKTMTEDFKKNSMGTRMSGRKHSEETKKKMSKSQRGLSKPGLRGRVVKEESKIKGRETRKRFQEENPEEYQKYLDKKSRAMKERHLNGTLNSSGESNAMFGKTQKEETRKLIGARNREAWERNRADPEKFAEQSKRRALSGKKSWEGNEERRLQTSIRSSRAYRKYGISQQEYYDQKLKPLLYLGFLPTAIEKFKLIDLSKGHIKAMILRFGSQEDVDQFNKNKKLGAGASKAYIKFQEDQYKKHFFCGPPHPNSL